jgi:hypothetical protein
VSALENHRLHTHRYDFRHEIRANSAIAEVRGEIHDEPEM